VFAVIAAACTGGSKAAPTSSGPEFPSGGTLRVATSLPYPLDHQADYSAQAWEIYRCCLLRTLLSYNGSPTEEGGAELQPDLAAEMPTVDSDGLTWTFHLKRGLHYAPPLQDVEITAQDIVRGLEREARVFHTVTAYGFYYAYGGIRGFRKFAGGKASSISGLEAPDRYTLRIRLTEPTGDLGYRLAMPAAAPIPPNPDEPDQELGVATGHGVGTVGGKGINRGYLRYLVASGPYMFAGSQDLDFSVPPDEQRPVAGYVPAKAKFGALSFRPEITKRGHITLVRNPSWDPATDPLRPAYPDRIEIATGFPTDEETAAIEAGRIDVLMGDRPDPELVDTYQASGLRGRVKTNPADAVFFDTFNLAQPPFDDIHVRRAASRVIDKARIVDETERSRDLPEFSPVTAKVATHLVMDSEENNLLLSYDPYRTPGNHGSVEAAKAEMRRSRYDLNHDGLCDAAACNDVLAVATDVTIPRAAGELIARDLGRIGIDLHLEWRSPGSWNAAINDPSKQVALGVGRNWGKDYPNAFTFFAPLFRSDSLGNGPKACCDWPLLGASAEQLKEWGYTVTDVPNVDRRIDRCVPLRGADQTECWAELDKYLMQDVVPWIPYLDLLTVDVVSSRVASFSWDQFTAMPALDHLALKPESS
jgi:peptide/nickel transport system substrate-binding protein